MESHLEKEGEAPGAVFEEKSNGLTDNSSSINNLDKEFNHKLKVHTADHQDSKSKEGWTEEFLHDYGEYPVAVKQNNIVGRYLVAKRDIPCGDVLMRDQPVFKGPNAGPQPTCLGCCIRLKEPLPCSKCGWPVCGTECENMPDHSNYECEIFSKNEIKPELPPPYCFIAGAEFIKVLRIILFSTGRTGEDKRKWELLQTLEPHIELRQSIPRVHFMSNISKEFIQDYCKLKQFPDEIIDFALGVVDVNAFRHTIHPNNPLRQEAAKSNVEIDRNATFIYPRGAMAAHGCRRNVRWETQPNGDLAMWSAEDIKQGESLTHPYVDLMQGTPDRRRQLKEQFYFDCSCPRCSDPTELGTFFSALKCPECKPGYLLPANPLDYKTDWKCNNPSGLCQCTKPYNYEREIVGNIQSEKKTVLEMLQGGSNLSIIGGLARILAKNIGRTVHYNHFAIIDIEYNLVVRMAKLKPTKDLLHEMRRLIHKFLDIAAVFYPGIK